MPDVGQAADETGKGPISDRQNAVVLHRTRPVQEVCPSWIVEPLLRLEHSRASCVER